MENSVKLLGWYGGDESHSLSAWTSTRRELDADRRQRMGEMLQNLAANNHHTPFEKSYLHFLVVCDTASHIHLLKHRIGVSINAESARYKELKEDKYYIPDDWPPNIRDWYITQVEQCYEDYHNIIKALTSWGIDRKRAKESARYILPYGNQTTMDIGFNFRSFANFLSLRRTQHSQVEIRNIANEMLRLVKTLPDFKLTIQAFENAKLLGND